VGMHKNKYKTNKRSAISSVEEDTEPAYGKVNNSEKLNFIDLFCGIGGFRIAFERAGCNCVWSNDWDKYSRSTYEANFGHLAYGDIHSVAISDIPTHNILCAGFPCQPFSIAGVSKKQSFHSQKLF
jgi:DNA (cytosine-5)-methyltransferase 1